MPTGKSHPDQPSHPSPPRSPPDGEDACCQLTCAPLGLEGQLHTHPRTPRGSFWDEKVAKLMGYCYKADAVNSMAPFSPRVSHQAPSGLVLGIVKVLGSHYDPKRTQYSG